jgi:dihydrolipoamide dehydrogenase
LGIDTVIADRDAVGGTCLNYGCIPSKALLTATGRIEAVEDAAEMGIEATTSVDFEQLVGWKDEVVDDLTSGVEALCQGNDVSVLAGHAKFLDGSTARVATDDGNTEVSFDNAIIATGSRPMAVPNFEYDGERILDSRRVLSLSKVPNKLVVVGAGYIGMELSTVFARLGTDVTVIELLNEAMPAFDQELTRPVV